MGDTRFPEIKKELLKDLEFIIDFDVTNESFDLKGRMDTLLSMKADPESTKSRKNTVKLPQ